MLSEFYFGLDMLCFLFLIPMWKWPARENISFCAPNGFIKIGITRIQHSLYARWCCTHKLKPQYPCSRGALTIDLKQSVVLISPSGSLMKTWHCRTSDFNLLNQRHWSPSQHWMLVITRKITFQHRYYDMKKELVNLYKSRLYSVCWNRTVVGDFIHSL